MEKSSPGLWPGWSPRPRLSRQRGALLFHAILPGPAQPSVPSGPVAASRYTKTAAYKERGDPRRPPAPRHSTALDATSHPCTSIPRPTSRLCPDPHQRSRLERRFPGLEREVGRSERGRTTPKGNAMLRHLGSNKSYMLRFSPP